MIEPFRMARTPVTTRPSALQWKEIRTILKGSWASRIPPSVLAIFTVMAILGTMVLCFLAFFRARCDAKRPALPPDSESQAVVTPYPPYVVVRTLVCGSSKGIKSVQKSS